MFGIPITPLGHLAHVLFPLPALAVLLWFFGKRSDPSAPWKTRIDLGLALICGLVLMGLNAFWMSRYFVQQYPLTASDFGQYCECVGVLREGILTGFVKQRSVVAGLIPSFFARDFGVVDGLFLGALFSHVVLGAGIFLWARAAHSRLAGVVAAVMVGSLAPLVHLTRTVTFYPEMVAGCVLSAAGAMLALRYRSLSAVVFSSLTASLVLLLDVRGLLWALPAIGLTFVAVCLCRGWLRKGVGLGCLLGCLLASHTVGSLVNWDESPSLEQQTVYYVDEALRRYSPNDPNAGLQTDRDVAGHRFVWGRSPLADIPKTLTFLWMLKQSLPEGIGNQKETRYGRRTHLLPWIAPAVGGFFLAVWGARRRRWVWLGFAGTLVPFAVALQGTADLVAHPRYMANGITMVPVLLGVGFAALYLGPLAREDRDRGSPVLGPRDGAAILGVLLCVLGFVPSWLSPVATWRAPVSADIEPANSVWYAGSTTKLPPDVSPRCVEYLKRDLENGLPLGSKLLGWTATESPTHAPTLEGE
jgi:hypothetical protein